MKEKVELIIFYTIIIICVAAGALFRFLVDKGYIDL